VRPTASSPNSATFFRPRIAAGYGSTGKDAFPARARRDGLDELGSVDPELFFPVSATGKSLEQATEAKRICAGCRVQRECLSFALRTLQAHGIWGGTTEEERAIARR
jgi:WhiB family redox-sensing transcriptional regulator